MPSQLPIPTLSDYVTAFHRGVKAKRERREDSHSGSVYDYVAGSTAMLMARESAYVRDLFQAIYEDLAVGQDLTDLIAGRYQIDRITDSYGTGFATLRRPNAAIDGSTPSASRVFWEGTRVLIQSPGTKGLVYAVAADTPIASGVTNVAGVPIRATTYGSGTAIDTTITGQLATFDDPTWDPSWTITSLNCSDGTTFEQAPAFRARVKATLLANLPGYTTGIVNACTTVGASNVAVFGTNFGGNDLFSCATFVGDAGFNGTSAMVTKIKLALESWRMLGAEMLIAPMSRVALPITASISLYDDPSKFDTATISAACASSIRRVLGATGAYGYDLDEFFGAIVNVSDAIQDVTFVTPTTSMGLLTGSPMWFPQILSRYQIPTNGISLSFTGPT